MAEENEEVRVNGMTLKEFADRCRRSNPITVYVYWDNHHATMRVHRIDPKRISEFCSDRGCHKHLHEAPNPYCAAYKKFYPKTKDEEKLEEMDFCKDFGGEDDKGRYVVNRYLIFAIHSVPVEEEGKAE